MLIFLTGALSEDHAMKPLSLGRLLLSREVYELPFVAVLFYHAVIVFFCRVCTCRYLDM